MPYDSISNHGATLENVAEKNRIEPFIRLVASFVSACIHKGARKGQASSVTAIKFLYNIVFHMLRYMRVNA